MQGSEDSLEPTTDAAYLEYLALQLRTMPRLGSEQDTPEGTRYVQISDTLALQVAARLDVIAELVEDLIGTAQFYERVHI